jgi:ABC-2 type transport system ATP-binding protein
VSFEVAAGEIFGLLGPNGAGKTTVVECVETLRAPDAGTIHVLGLDARRDVRAIRLRTGVQLQEGTLQERLKVWEALDLFGALYPERVAWRPLLEELGLAECAHTMIGKLSGGQRQRVAVALALVNAPSVVFLDELTTALDPHGRRAIWDLVLRVRARGTTVVLTTHFMEEAERLCDRVAIMSRGRIIALDAPARLIGTIGARSVSFAATDGFDERRLGAVPGVTRVVRRGGRIEVYGDGDDLAADVVTALDALGVRCHGLETAQATLEDLFLAITGDHVDADKEEGG